MRWNVDTKSKAIDMISNGVSVREIAKIFNMSESSVTLLKYSKVKNSLERVKCEVCGGIFKQITIKHLKDHNMSLDEYKIKYPCSQTITNYRSDKYKSFKHPNKGKTYEEIYGEKEALNKKEKISTNQIGREAPLLAGTGITGTRKDTGMFARSCYEANIDRIFAFENKRICGEFSEPNKRFQLIKKDGTEISYQPDRIDIDGLFLKDAFLEIKGYMYPDDWEKICLFREQNVDKKLLVISGDSKYKDIDYLDLERKYKRIINLWEDDYQNYKKNPEIYKIDYIEPEIVKYYKENYRDGVHISISNNHMIEIAKKCGSYCSVRLGEKTYIDSIKLIGITDRRPHARISTGKYHYELWEAISHKGEKYYITNQDKTTLFYCYEASKFNEINEFFENNCNMSLNFGPKEELIYRHILPEVLEKCDRKDILKRIEDIFSHNSIPHVVRNIEIIHKEETKRGALNDREEWQIIAGTHKYKISNFGNPTNEYNLIEL